MRKYQVSDLRSLAVAVGTLALVASQAETHADHGDRAAAEASVQATDQQSAESQTLQAGMRIREGARIADVIGEFQKTADRYTFLEKDAKHGMRVLENLALERVARILEDDPSPRLWSVSGTITEYRGENFLMMTRAVLKPRVVPAPRKIETKESAL